MGRFLRSSRWHRTRALGAVVVTVAAGLLVLAAPANADTSAALYTPNISANPNEDASYPRVIRLQNSGSSNGTLLSTFSHSGFGSSRANFPIYRSTTAKRGPVHLECPRFCGLEIKPQARICF